MVNFFGYKLGHCFNGSACYISSEGKKPRDKHLENLFTAITKFFAWLEGSLLVLEGTLGKIR